ncbi:MAG: phosphate ABC transporter ATP-binding protein PstB [Rickettsiales bacterium]
MTKNIITVKNLNFFYENHQALHDINIYIKKNSVTALIGPSGCGKSTFLRCINRMNELNNNTRVTGQVKFEGHDIYSKTTDLVKLRTQIGMVFQTPNCFPKTVYENVAYAPKIHKTFKTKKALDALVKDSLMKTGLYNEVKDKLHHSALKLSGGQQQRLCIARTISINPKVILMDEPCSALDPIATAKVESLIDDLSKNYTIIIITHSMQQAARVSSKAVFFEQGKIIEQGDTKELFTNPKSKRTQNYITGRFG